MQHIGEVVGPGHLRRQGQGQGAFEALDQGLGHVFPLIDRCIGVAAGTAHGIADGAQAGLDLVFVIVAKVSQASDDAVVLVLDAQFLVDAGFGLEVAAGALAVAALAAAVEQVIGVELVQVRRFVGAGDTGLEGDGVGQGMGQVERRAPVVADHAVMVQAQARSEHGAR